MLLSNNSYDNHGIHDNIVLPDITILKISLRYQLSWHFDIMINDNIVILPNSTCQAVISCHMYVHNQCLCDKVKNYPDICFPIIRRLIDIPTDNVE